MLRAHENQEVVFTPIYDILANFSLGGTCSTDKAWQELVELRHKKGLMSGAEYKNIKIKDSVYRLLHGLRG